MAGTRRPQGLALLLAQLGAHAADRFADRLAELGLSPAQSSILSLLSTHPGLSQQQLAQLLGMLPSRVVAVVDSMEEAGLVRRVRGETDRRRNTLVPTPAGTAALQRIGTLAREHEDDVCRSLSAAERTQLYDLLARISDQQGLSPRVPPG